eukprot:TRINITY_DN1609_c0_g1_i1.p2 TRINITY_DN1609_c0_g1~~TRINITY_DN1609_c0_g1_i1.p2  ORF type:complete len:68 (+),score=9.30 TRINITY_DN1609_c0_g1_i1:485-688(+)
MFGLFPVRFCRDQSRDWASLNRGIFKLIVPTSALLYAGGCRYMRWVISDSEAKIDELYNYMYSFKKA